MAGRNADDGVDFAVQRDAPSQGFGRRAKFALPDSVAENSHRSRARPVLLRAKIAAEQRLEAQCREKFCGNHVRVQAQRFSHAGHIEIVRPKRAQVGKGMIVFLPVEKVRIRDRAFLEGPRSRIDGHKFTGIRKRQRIQEHAVDHRKQGAVRADAQGKCQDRNRGESRVFP